MNIGKWIIIIVSQIQKQVCRRIDFLWSKTKLHLLMLWPPIRKRWKLQLLISQNTTSYQTNQTEIEKWFSWNEHSIQHIDQVLFFHKSKVFRPSFFKDFIAVLCPFSETFLLAFRKQNNIWTHIRTTVVVCLCTSRTLNKQQMTSFISTVDMGITRRATLVTDCNNHVWNFLGSSLVKHKVFSAKFIVQPLCFYLSRILNNTTF